MVKKLALAVFLMLFVQATLAGTFTMKSIDPELYYNWPEFIFSIGNGGIENCGPGAEGACEACYRNREHCGGSPIGDCCNPQNKPGSCANLPTKYKGTTDPIAPDDLRACLTCFKDHYNMYTELDAKGDDCGANGLQAVYDDHGYIQNWPRNFRWGPAIFSNVNSVIRAIEPGFQWQGTGGEYNAALRVVVENMSGQEVESATNDNGSSLGEFAEVELDHDVPGRHSYIAKVYYYDHGSITASNAADAYNQYYSYAKAASPTSSKWKKASEQNIVLIPAGSQEMCFLETFDHSYRSTPSGTSVTLEVGETLTFNGFEEFYVECLNDHPEESCAMYKADVFKDGVKINTYTSEKAGAPQTFDEFDDLGVSGSMDGSCDALLDDEVVVPFNAAGNYTVKFSIKQCEVSTEGESYIHAWGGFLYNYVNNLEGWRENQETGALEACGSGCNEGLKWVEIGEHDVRVNNSGNLSIDVKNNSAASYTFLPGETSKQLTIEWRVKNTGSAPVSLTSASFSKSDPMGIVTQMTNGSSYPITLGVGRTEKVYENITVSKPANQTTVSLTAIVSFVGGSDSGSMSYTFNPGAGATDNPPVAMATGGSCEVTGAWCEITLSSNGSYDPEGAAIGYDWSIPITLCGFATGSSRTSQNPTIRCVNQGNGTATLVVTELTGKQQSASAVASVTVTASGNRPPEADVGGPYTCQPPCVVNFDGSGSSDPDGHRIVDYWKVLLVVEKNLCF